MVVGDATLIRETMGMTVELTQVHLPDVEVHELSFVRGQGHGLFLLGLERVVGVQHTRRITLNIRREPSISTRPCFGLSLRPTKDRELGVGWKDPILSRVQIYSAMTLGVRTIRGSQMIM
jgi:hypothetical protein